MPMGACARAEHDRRAAPGCTGRQLEHLDRVFSQFEAFCTVTKSVGRGIPITVQVFDATGAQLK